MSILTETVTSLELFDSLEFDRKFYNLFLKNELGCYDIKTGGHFTSKPDLILVLPRDLAGMIFKKMSLNMAYYQKLYKYKR